MLVNVEDARQQAHRRLPRVFFDYIDGAAFSEETARRNIEDFSAYTLRQQVLCNVAERSLATTVLGKQQSLPFFPGPVGFSGLFARNGEIQAARAAHAAGVPYCLSTFAIASLEEVRAATDGALWFQLYVLKDRALSRRMIEKAVATGVEALIVTVDTPAGGVREKDVRNGFRSLTRVTPRLAFALAQKPLWCASILRGGIPTIGNLENLPEYGANALEQAARLANHIDAGMTWDDISEIRALWPGKLVLKGILGRHDALEAVKRGADAVIVSNHGGRQLDCAPSTISVLSEVVDAVDGAIEVLFDGGIRRGTHVVKALALGAKAVLLGRAVAYGLAAKGQAGVSAVFGALATEVDSTMAHMGLRDLSSITRQHLAARQSYV